MESSAPGRYELQFTGEGSTYFGIWIVNLVLTILTLGIFSPWAKVRRLRYFYGNTLLDGSPFEFHGSPIALLKGRVIGVILLVAYTQAGKISASLWLAVVAAIALGLPWLLWKSQKFRLCNSSYRGIRFGFDGSLREAYATFALPILLFFSPYFLLMSLGLRVEADQAPTPAQFAPIGILYLLLVALAPWLYLRIKRFQHANARLGSTPFSFSGTLGGAYGLAFAALGLGILAVIIALVLGGIGGLAAHWIAGLFGYSSATSNPSYAGTSAQSNQVIGTMTGIAIGYVVLLGAYPIFAALKQNFVWGNTGLACVSFKSRAQGLKLLRIAAGNAALIVVTLGLYWPYAAIRTLRYQLTAVSWDGDPAQIYARPAEGGVTAAGEEAAELLGFDLAL